EERPRKPYKRSASGLGASFFSGPAKRVDRSADAEGDGAPTEKKKGNSVSKPVGTPAQQEEESSGGAEARAAAVEDARVRRPRHAAEDRREQDGSDDDGIEFEVYAEPMEGDAEEGAVVVDPEEQARVREKYDKRAELFRTEHLQVNPSTIESDRAKSDRLTGYRVFRAMAPYIAVHYGSVVVIHVPGEVLESQNAEQVMHDIVLLKTLGIRPVLVAGCRPQIRRKLEQVGKKSLFVQGNRVCDTETLYHCQSVAGHVRLYIESLLTRGLMNSPTGVGSVQVTSGNFVKAIAFGVRGGIDFLHTGIVKKVAASRVHQLLDEGDVVVLSHLGVSQSGTIYHCRSEDVAVQAAIDLNANKLVFLHNGEGLVDKRKLGGAIVHNLPLNVARQFTARLAEELGQSGQEYVSHSSEVDPKTMWKLQFLDYMQGAIRAVQQGVHRAHLVSRHIEGSIVSELCTRDGIGLLISQDLYDGVRPATVHDVPAIKSLIAPLEKSNILITRPPKMIEKDVDNFIVFEREGMILASCHLYHYPDTRYGNGAVEMSCVAVSAALHGEGIGNALLSYCLRRAFSQNIRTLFVLTTRTQGWFIDRGFKEVGPEWLPPNKLKTYDYSRNSKVFIKTIESERAIDEEEIIWFRQKNSK
ncbi:Amino-acid acetyltransferase (N-acetylglutamate synthase) (AGS) (NAGS), partial [Durusdinium trenchii]